MHELNGTRILVHHAFNFGWKRVYQNIFKVTTQGSSGSKDLQANLYSIILKMTNMSHTYIFAAVGALPIVEQLCISNYIRLSFMRLIMLQPRILNTNQIKKTIKLFSSLTKDENFMISAKNLN